MCPWSVTNDVCIMRVSLREKICRAFPRDKRKCPLYTGLRIKRVSKERGSTVYS